MGSIGRESLCKGVQLISNAGPLGIPGHWAMHSCPHNDDRRDFHSRLTQRKVEGSFVASPRVGAKDLLACLNEVPDPTTCCESSPKLAAHYDNAGNSDEPSCPLQPMTIRGNLAAVSKEWEDLNNKPPEEAFGNGAGSG